MGKGSESEQWIERMSRVMKGIRDEDWKRSEEESRGKRNKDRKKKEMKEGKGVRERWERIDRRE